MHNYLICKLADYNFGTSMMNNICGVIDNQIIKTKKNLNILDSLFEYFSRFKPQFSKDINPGHKFYQSNLIGGTLEKMIYENVVFKEWLMAKVNSKKIQFKYRDSYYQTAISQPSSNVFGDTLIFKNGVDRDVTINSEAYMSGVLGPCLVFNERGKEIII